MNNIKISVLMPVYNANKYIKAAVDSILKQTFTDFEFIIINDGSTDGTLEILENYAKKDKRIRLISRENKGLVTTLNEGVALAKFPLIARMDADDIALPNRFREQIDFLKEHNEVVALGGSFIIIDDKSRELHLLMPPLDNESIQINGLKGHCPINHPTAMIRTDSIRNVGGYRDEFYPSEDLDLWLRLGEIGKLVNLENAVIKYRFLSNSISGRMSTQQNNAARAAVEAAWKRRGIVNGIFESTGEWRAGESKISQHVFLIKFGWWAFNYRNKSASIVYGLKAIQLLPLNKEGWRLLYCGLFKRP